MHLILAGAFFALGAILASFISVIAERLHTGESWISGRSRCNSCGEALSSRDLVPILSWLASAGRCRSCGVRVTASYLASETILGGLFLASYLMLGISLPLIPLLLSLVVLLFIVTYDLRHMIVPQGSSALLLIFSLAYAILMAGGPEHLGQTLLVAGFIGLGFFLFYLLSGGRMMGLGDSPVALALSLLTGGSLALAGLLFSFWIGAIVGIGILLTRRGGPRMGIEVPFVPFLAAGYLLAFFTHWNPLLFTGHL